MLGSQWAAQLAVMPGSQWAAQWAAPQHLSAARQGGRPQAVRCWPALQLGVLLPRAVMQWGTAPLAVGALLGRRLLAAQLPGWVLE